MPSENTKNTCSENSCEGCCENCHCSEASPKSDVLVGNDVSIEDFDVPKKAFALIAQTVLATLGVKLFAMLDPVDHERMVLMLRLALKESGERLNYDMSNYFVGDEEPVENE